MKKTLLAAAFTLALGSTTAMAGGIQIDPTGTGNIGSSTFLTGLGDGGIGNFLLDDLVVTSGLATGEIYAHSVIDLTSTIGGELTYVLRMDVDSTPQIIDVFGDGTLLVPNLNSANLSNPAGHSSVFELYYNAALGTANTMTGGGFDTGVLLASGAVSINTATSAGMSADPSVAASTLADNNAALSDEISGAFRLNVDFTVGTVNTDFVVNDLAGLAIDLETTNGLNAPFTAIDDRAGKGYADGAYASTTVGGAGGKSAFFGLDGENDFSCAANGLPGSGGVCDIQTQMNTTLAFQADRVPEPVTLALMGAGLGLMGGLGRRRRNSSK